ncbi:hypothetical protein [Nocardioides litoris]|uniref:hypothetical protein n=1 Tax=Nocardioides litoris TaxID=1926648 RepID=UPI001122C5B4|nr:hypothetical protein [Nocardioides litoris]
MPHHLAARACCALVLLVSLLAVPSAQAEETLPVEERAFTWVSGSPVMGVPFRGSLYFRASDRVHGQQMWRSDGTPEGTAMVTDDLGERGGGFSLYATTDRLFMVTVGGQVHVGDETGQFERVTGFDGLPTGDEDMIVGTIGDRFVFADRDHALYAVDPGLTAARRFSPGYGQFEFSSGTMAVLDGWGYFAGWSSGPSDSPYRGIELYRTDGVTTELVKDLRPGPDSGTPHGFRTIGGRVWFSSGPTLWTTDGTPEGTRRFAAASGPGDLASTVELPGRTDKLFLLSDVHQRLWLSDGTAAGSREVMREQSGLTVLAATARHLYVTTTTDRPSPLGPRTEAQRLLWRVDAATGRPAFVAGLPDAPTGGSYSAVVGDLVYFTGWSDFGRVLWRTDGTTRGTFPLSRGGLEGPTLGGDPDLSLLGAIGGRVLVASHVRRSDGSVSDDRQLQSIDTTRPSRVRAATTAPRITGTARPIGELTVSRGVWTTAPNLYRYQWFRNGVALDPAFFGGPRLALHPDGQRVQGEDRHRLFVRPGDRIHAVVTASGIGSPPAGAASAPVVIAPLLPAAGRGRAVIRGRPEVGERLTVRFPAPTRGARVFYRWRVGGQRVPERTRHLRITRAFVGRQVRVQVDVRHPGRAAVHFLSRRTGPVRP